MYHGHTLTSKILFRDIISTLKEYAFKVSGSVFSFKFGSLKSNITSVVSLSFWKNPVPPPSPVLGLISETYLILKL